MQLRGEPKIKIWGTDGHTKTDEFSENFQMTGWRGYFQPKYLYCRFWNFEQDFLSIRIGEGKEKKFQVYRQIPILWSNIRLLV